MTSVQWRTGCICIAILSAAISLPFGGTGEIIILGSVILAVAYFLLKRENTDLYILAAGQILVYGASYGSYIAAIACEICLFAVFADISRKILLFTAFISLAILGIAAEMMQHTGWWIAGLILLCIILIISGYAREEAITRDMRSNLDD